MVLCDILPRGTIFWSGMNITGNRPIHIMWMGRDYTVSSIKVISARKEIVELLGIPTKEVYNSRFPRMLHCEIAQEEMPIDPIVLRILAGEIVNGDVEHILKSIDNW